MSELFSDLKCGLTNDHVVQEPINLRCGHSICKKCVPDQTVIICKICNVETNRSELKVTVLNRVKNNLSGLFNDLEKNTNDQINTLKS